MKDGMFQAQNERTASDLKNLKRDPLTGVYNRDSFFKLAETMIHEHEPGYYVLSCFDIDNFKVINDQYGIKKGDLVLKHVGDCIGRSASQMGGISCHIAADDFVILFPASFKDTLSLKESHIRATSPECISHEIRISIGRYIVDDLSLSVSAMYDRAILAEETITERDDIYIAEYEESMRERLLHEQKIVTQMHDALENEEFELWFQPQYNHMTETLIGAEVLVRWRHGNSGEIVVPGEFVPVFERNGFIYELDKYVWEQACILLHEWKTKGCELLPLSVNVSRYDILREDFEEVITGLVKKYDIPNDMLHLEVTESAFADISGQVVGIIKRLIAFGFTVEIDDFGSGYSSLNTLKDVPAATLKLDMKFLEQTGDSKRGGNILQSVVRMARWLGMSVIAEGVETRAQADFLKSIGCVYVQGYLYARPMPIDEYKSLLEASPSEKRVNDLRVFETPDNDSFWDPGSMDTLILNSFVGGACIFEYHNEHIDFLRATDKFAKLLGGDNMTVEDVLSVHWINCLDEESHKKLRDALHSACKTKEEVSAELRLTDLPNGSPETYFLTAMKVIATASDRVLFYSSNQDVTAHRLAEKEVRYIDDQLRFLNVAAHDLLAQPNSQKAMDSVLEKVKAYFNAERSYVFEFDFNKKIMKNTYELCDENVSVQMENLQEIPLSMASFWLDSFKKEYYINIQSVKALSDDRSEKQILLNQNIESLFAAPLMRDGKIIGFIGVDNPQIHKANIDRLIAIGDYATVLLTRRDLNIKIQRDNDLMRMLMDDTPGGFCRMQLLGDFKPPIVYINEGFCRLLGMTHNEVISAYGTDAFGFVHPQDKQYVRDTASKMNFDNGQFSVECRVKAKSGEYIWAMVVGRFVKEESGETYLNAYFSDITEQKKKVDRQKELLDNLPCGAGLYEYDGERMNVIYVNRSYQQMVGRNINADDNPSIFDVVHSEDVARVRDILSKLTAKDIEAEPFDVRVKHADGRYHSYRINSRILDRHEGKWSSCITFLPIPDDEMTMQQIMPHIFPAIMSSSTDVTFAKDCDFRYLCCSRAFANMIGMEDEADVVGKTDYELFPIEVAKYFREADAKLVKSGKPIIDMVETIPSKDGMPYYSKTSKYAIRDAGDRVIAIYGIGRDITENREAYAQLQLLTDSIPGGLATYTCSGDIVRLTYYNEGFCDLFGYTRDEFETFKGGAAPITFIFDEDRVKLDTQFNKLMKNGTPMDCVYRVHVHNGGTRWISHKAVIADRYQNVFLVNAVLFDITQQEMVNESLRISEEENRLAILHSGNIIGRYNVKDSSLTLPNIISPIFELSGVLEDVPDRLIKDEYVSPETSEIYKAFYEDIRNGEKDGSATFQQWSKRGWRWLKAQFTTIFSNDNEPISAVISFVDITERLEKEVVYNKWQQSLEERPDDSYTLFRCNLSKEATFDSCEGSLLKIKFDSNISSFAERTSQYAIQFVYSEDRQEYIDFLNTDVLLANYHRGNSSAVLEYREKLEDDGVRWLRLSVDLVEYPTSSDVEIYMMYENIDERKKTELMTIERSERDPLTGVYNRSTFISKVDNILSEPVPGASHYLLMLDVDEFKGINDTFGHGAGDKVLIEITTQIKSILRSSDFIGRLGGDEFFVFLKDMPGDAVSTKAKQICKKVTKPLGSGINMSCSIGIAGFPTDGRDFDALYKNADTALYYEKRAGKGSYTFYRKCMK